MFVSCHKDKTGHFLGMSATGKKIRIKVVYYQTDTSEFYRQLIATYNGLTQQRRRPNYDV
jgi:hypothetical protein